MKDFFYGVIYVVVFIVALWFLGYAKDRIFDSKNYYPDTRSNTIEFHRLRWFKPDEVYKLKWMRLNSEEEGWCAKSPKGFWYIFVKEDFGNSPPYDEYDSSRY